ncbi:serine hydrolase [Lentzea sp. NBRC 105346]|uniref:serine hydrolase domain-containing protein n=1 Tax=Lentzea sp. NBRC 105346 TaxID=3032205 RepID=UPI00249FC2A6|nr:serine hydrolase domain-containing protein [Lentzea sp. NBRC 105346]GLZ33784.1 serine hydrolase [Lentzea sp. NBRC 105346]
MDVPSDFSGVISIDGDARAYGLAHRGYGIPNTPDTRFAIASGNKGFTALAVMSLVEGGELSLDTRAREVLGDDLPLVDGGVTVEHLLAHRSGIGDYFDEDEHPDINEYVLTRPVHELVDTEDFLPVLDGHPQKFPPGERFAYCNGGYVLLALIAQRVSGISYHDLVHSRVCEPAGMTDTAFLRSDRPEGRTAVGYLSDGRTNVFHLPVVGNGDGGIYTTAADIDRFWVALFAGKIVGDVARMTRDEHGVGYGLGFWLPEHGVKLEGYDAGVSFRSVRRDGTTTTVISNTADGAWPVSRMLGI